MSEHNSPPPPLLSRRRLLALGAATAGTLAGLSPRLAGAQTKLTVTEGTIRPIPIALPDFITEPGVPDAGMGRNITQIIASNLRRSGLFAPIDQKAYIERITDFNRHAAIRELAQIGADALVTGRLERQGNGNVAAPFRLWDVIAGEQLHAPADLHQSRTTIAGSRTSSPTRSISGSPARRAISTPASSSSTSPARAISAPSGSRSWIRTAPMCATSRAATISC